MQEILDSALSFAKRRGDPYVSVFHMIYVIADQFRDSMPDFILLEHIIAKLPPKRVSDDHQLKCSDVVLSGIQIIQDRSTAIEWVKNAYNQYVVGDGVEIPPEGVDTRSSRATEPLPTAVPDNKHHGKTSSARTTRVQTASKSRSLSEVLQELDSLIGLQSVKAEVRRIIATQQAVRVLKGNGVEIPLSRHLVFAGPPGTGKTTVARLFGEVYRTIGLIQSDTFIEVGRADLVGAYVGHTALKTRELFGRAIGGVLFVDEAYSLTPSSDNDFGHEVLAELVALMENHRHSTIVILAGYSDLMDQLLDANPGLRSRIGHIIHFAPYNSDEMVQIYQSYAHKYKILVSDEAIVQLREYIGQHQFDGNARTIRTLWERTFSAMAERANADSVINLEELGEIVPHDIHEGIKHYLSQERRKRSSIGFSTNSSAELPKNA